MNVYEEYISNRANAPTVSTVSSTDAEPEEFEETQNKAGALVQALSVALDIE